MVGLAGVAACVVLGARATLSSSTAAPLYAGLDLGLAHDLLTDEDLMTGLDAFDGAGVPGEVRAVFDYLLVQLQLMTA